MCRRKCPWYNRHGPVYPFKFCGQKLQFGLSLWSRVSLRGKAEDAGSWRIVLGKHQLKRSETAERVFPVKRIYRHEHFRYPTHSELDYDIALVKAATDILPSNFIRYACLPRKQTSLKPGHYCWVTGWGDTRGELGWLRGMDVGNEPFLAKRDGLRTAFNILTI